MKSTILQKESVSSDSKGPLKGCLTSGCNQILCRSIVLGHALSVALTSILTYILSVIYRDQPPFIPSVSITWQFYPESKLFGMAMAVHCFLGIMTIVIRYKYLLNGIDQSMKKTGILNKAALYIGFIAMLFGICTSYFPLNSNNTVHYTVAGIYMVSYGVYNIIQGILSFLISCSVACGKKLICTRFVIIFLIILTGLSYGIIWPLHWTYPYLYAVGNGFQWAYCFCLVAFPLTFIPEFHNVRASLNIEYHL